MLAAWDSWLSLSRTATPRPESGPRRRLVSGSARFNGPMAVAGLYVRRRARETTRGSSTFDGLDSWLDLHHSMRCCAAPRDFGVGRNHSQSGSAICRSAPAEANPRTAMARGRPSRDMAKLTESEKRHISGDVLGWAA